MDAKKKRVFIILLLVIMGLPIFVSSQDAVGCCITEGTCNGVTGLQECTGDGSVFYAESCTTLPLCDQVCCEFAESVPCQFIVDARCAYQGGQTVPGINDENTCTSICGDGVYISGMVNYSNGVSAPLANVQVLNSVDNQVITEGVADESGGFSLLVPVNSDYNVLALAPGNSQCSSVMHPVQVLVANINIGHILLNCQSVVDPPVCESSWDCSPWEPGPDCGTRSCIDSNSCSPPTNVPISYVPCGESVCGNGNLEQGEDCEQPDIFREGYASCEERLGEGYVGSVVCTYNCQVQTNCVDCSNGCTDASLCTICDACEGDPICADVCDASEIVTPFDAVGIYEESTGKGIGLTWGINELCTLSSSTKIFRCKANEDMDACAPNSPLKHIDTVSGAIFEYSDYELGTATAYCYNLSVNVNNGLDSFTIGPSELACAKVWDDACLENPNGAHCDGNSLVQCEGGYLVGDEECVCGCIEDTSGIDPVDATCVELDDCNQCDLCSGPFGLFPYINYDFPEIYSAWEFQSCLELRELSYCFVDEYSKTNAIIGEYQYCSDINSCYDYRTKSSCTNNPCNLDLTSNCAWQSLSEGNELGLGVCIPSDMELQDCSKCDSLGILGNYCPEQLCSLFGKDEQGNSNCYYNSELKSEFEDLYIDNSSCINKAYVACETYDSMQECTGAGGGNIQGTPFRINVYYQYDAENSEYIRTGNNNRVTTNSSDLFERGKCVWQENKCIKDANNDAGLINNDDYEDCPTNKGLEHCFLDFDEPNTTLYIGGQLFVDGAVYSKAELALLTAAVTENADTYFNIGTTSQNPKSGEVIPPGDYVFNYPQFELQDFITVLSALNAESNKNHALYFYSEDLAKNLEEVKTLTFELLKDLSGVEVNYVLSSAFYLNSNTFLTNLTVDVEYDENLTCRVNLSDITGDQENFIGDATRSTPELTWKYDYLIDGNYLITTHCTDDHLQSFTNFTAVAIDADISIYNATPKGKTYRAGPVNIGIRTENNGVCYYTKNEGAQTPEFPGLPTMNLVPTGEMNVNSDWVQYALTGEKNHNSTIIEEIGDENTGIKLIYSGCWFINSEGQTEWYMGNDGDTIYYAIDETAPQITLIDGETELPYDNSTFVEELILKLYCSDYDSRLEAGLNYSFGCKTNMTVSKYYVNYSWPHNVVEVFPARNLTQGQEIVIGAPLSYVQIYLNITSDDKGGNSNNFQTFVNVRNLSFMDPIAVICDPDTGVCT
ncbi:MAG: carboxypeptidase-like regulatory domain-containing protein [Candidatus Nanoarchaeia archaeon]